MAEWEEAWTFRGIGIKHIPLSENFHLTVNYRRGGECRDGSWQAGSFLVGVASEKAYYGHLFLDIEKEIETAEEAYECIFRFTGEYHIPLRELREVQETNGRPFGLAEPCACG